MKKHWCYIVVSTIWVCGLFLCIHKVVYIGKSERINNFLECKASFEKIVEALISRDVKGESFFKDFEKGILENHSRKIMLDDNVFQDVIDFSEYGLDCITIDEEQIVEFEYGLGAEFVIYSRNNSLSKQKLKKISGLDRNNKIRIYTLSKGWYMVQNIVR